MSRAQCSISAARLLAPLGCTADPGPYKDGTLIAPAAGFEFVTVPVLQRIISPKSVKDVFGLMLNCPRDTRSA